MSLEQEEPKHRRAYQSMGAGRVTPVELRRCAQAIRAGRVRQTAGDRSIENVKRFRFSARIKGHRDEFWDAFTCTHRTKILADRGYAMIGPDDHWVLTAAGDEWLDAELVR